MNTKCIATLLALIVWAQAKAQQENSIQGVLLKTVETKTITMDASAIERKILIKDSKDRESWYDLKSKCEFRGQMYPVATRRSRTTMFSDMKPGYGVRVDLDESGKVIRINLLSLTLGKSTR